MGGNKKLFIVSILLILLISCKSTQEIELFNTGKTREEFMAEISLFSVKEPVTYSEEISAYIQFYGLGFKNIHHYSGYLDLLEYRIFTQIFIPQESKKIRGTVYVFHSYLAHTGIMNELIGFLLTHEYSVCAIDFPGHGLSSGIRGNINDFHQYGELVHTLLTKTLAHLTPPFYAVGHSTGSSAIIDYFLQYTSQFQYHILMGPLIHSDMWCLSKIGYALIGWVHPQLPYWHRDISSDKEYLEFIRTEKYLFVREVPITWVKALFEWNDYLESLNKNISVPLHVIQGKKDIVVDWRYNIPFLHNLIPGVKITFIEKGKHDLHNECDEIQDEVFQLILEDLSAVY